MIDKLSMKFSLYIKNKYPNELPSVEIINYVHKFFFSNVIPVILILLVSYLLNSFQSVLIALTSFALLRSVSGGLHLKRIEMCLILSTLVILFIPLMSEFIVESVHYITFLSLLLVSYYAPSNILKQTKIPEQYFIYLKIISMVIVASNFIIKNEIVATSFFVQAITLIRLKGGEKNV